MTFLSGPHAWQVGFKSPDTFCSPEEERLLGTLRAAHLHFGALACAVRSRHWFLSRSALEAGTSAAAAFISLLVSPPPLAPPPNLRAIHQKS